ncbi:hypothetical protein [Streptomyces sp. SAI-090]|jgi:hypothetical protein|uniref:hypothetical protein n=1 Tax=Streptomyces sp. SAI-090 TaxID=2940545 RepID=UPI0024747E0B|nr:hypothetical protein [Streptomyces sp. SAI-090]MDH6522293.1 hypothetical protein [Streptomyces sp. SAI-090]
MSNTKKTKKPQTKIGRMHTRSVPSRIFGWSLLWISLVVVVLNWIEEFSELNALPGGHSVFYLMGGILGAAVGAWRAGVFDAKS